MSSSKPLPLNEISDAILEAHIALAEAAALCVQGSEVLEWCDVHFLLQEELRRRHWQRRRAERARLEAMQQQLFVAAAAMVATATGEVLQR